jgi:hypothetical protein
LSIVSHQRVILGVVQHFFNDSSPNYTWLFRCHVSPVIYYAESFFSSYLPWCILLWHFWHTITVLLFLTIILLYHLSLAEPLCFRVASFFMWCTSFCLVNHIIHTLALSGILLTHCDYSNWMCLLLTNAYSSILFYWFNS